jgi:hypothetical protein
MNKIPASLRSDSSDCRFAPECMPLCIAIGGDFIGIPSRPRGLDEIMKSGGLLRWQAELVQSAVEKTLHRIHNDGARSKSSNP